MLLLALVACTPTPYQSGAGEVFQVRNGTFEPGDLPVDATATTPSVIYASGASYVLTQGYGNVAWHGLASTDAYSVAVKAQEISTGYSVVALQGPDATQDNDLILDLDVDFLADIPYGAQTLQFSAIDEHGNPGPEYHSSICILPDWAENSLATCSDAITPPSAVFSLTWDTDVDLDLVVIAPNGKIVDSGAPTTGLLDGNSVPRDTVKDPTTGKLSRDSNADCHIDGTRLESLVFEGAPPPGNYKFYADLHATCGQPYVNFSLDEYTRTDAADGSHPIMHTALGTGELVAVQADGGNKLGSYLTTVTVPDGGSP